MLSPALTPALNSKLIQPTIRVLHVTDTSICQNGVFDLPSHTNLFCHVFPLQGNSDTSTQTLRPKAKELFFSNQTEYNEVFKYIFFF